ncbi:MAG: hypothetical protein U0175_03805 [Caldilineaceae bacterium]
MAKKTLANAQRRQQKEARRKQRIEKRQKAEAERPLRLMQQQIQANEHLSGLKVVRNQMGSTPMSQLLGKVIQPFIQDAENRDQVLMLAQMGVVAWNISLLSEEERADELGKMREVMKEGSDDFEKLIQELMERKQELYPNVKRKLLDVNVREEGSRFHLTVVSSPT